MTHRILPSAEWEKLEGTSLGPVWRALPTSGVTVIVVEDTDGAIIAHWTFFQCLHAEQLWVAPAHRKRGSAARHLVRAMHEMARAIGTTAFITAADSAEVTALLHGLGAARLPGDAYTVPVPERR